jgi:hypothetical protein
MKFLEAIVATMATAPLLATAQQLDWEAISRNFPPSHGEYAILSYYDIGTVINPSGIETALGDIAAMSGTCLRPGHNRLGS